MARGTQGLAELRAELGQSLETLQADATLADTAPRLSGELSTERPSYFVLIEWNGEHVGLIRDFRYVPYLADAAPFTPA